MEPKSPAGILADRASLRTLRRRCSRVGSCGDLRRSGGRDEHKREGRKNMNLSCRVAFAAAGALVAAWALRMPAYAAGPEVVAGPAADPGCFVPWTERTKFFKFPAKQPPFRIALANGYVANTW